MRTKADLFFPPAVNNQPKESPLDFAKKTIDALIAYNKSILTRLLPSKEISQEIIAQEAMEINLALYFDYSEVPTLIKMCKSPFGENANLTKQSLKTGAINEIKRYEYIKAQLDKGNLDYVYLSCFYTHTTAIAELLDKLKKKEFESWLSKFFTKEFAKKKSKQIATNIQKNKSALMVEYNALAEILDILKPQCSSNCLRLVENINIIMKLVYDPETQTEKTSVTLGCVDYDKILRNRGRYQALSWSNEELKKLTQEYNQLTKKMTTDLTDIPRNNYLTLYGILSDLYRVEAQIDKLIEAHEAQKKKADALEKEKQIALALESEKEKPLQELKIETAPLVTLAEEILETQTLEDLAKESFSIIEPVLAEPVMNSGEKGELEEKPEPEQKREVNELKEDKQAQEEPVYIYQPYYKKAEKQVQCAQQNILNLKEDDRKTYLQVFAKPPCASINLRALVNLTLSFGGTIKTTGSNRCRIEIQNIYAFVAVPQEALEKPCNSATVTMHGGGHRSKPSQNHDREKAPGYLIEQFKDAFVRAGLTPKNLGLDLESTVSTAVLK